MTPTPAEVELFHSQLWDHYRSFGRHELPWREVEKDGTIDPYAVLVSELMLQQTQVGRVLPKFAEFITQFPTTESLAAASLGDVIRAWQGLGYNRRAKYLWQAAQLLNELGSFPRTEAELVALPGVGKNTAGAILAYSFNLPTVFIETNIRTVYFHHFTHDEELIPDTVLRELVADTLDREHPREFYWAVMDYGSWLKTKVRNNAMSTHYRKQSGFEGSRRQLRGKVLRYLAAQPASLPHMAADLQDERLSAVLQDLEKEGLIRSLKGLYQLA